MSITQFLELAVSLSLQTTLVVAATYWATHCVAGERIGCRLWTACYVSLLLLLAVGLLLPHPRWLSPWAKIDDPAAVVLVEAQIRIGGILFVVWMTGAGISLLLFAMRSIHAALFIRQCTPLDSRQLADDVLLRLLEQPGKAPIRLLTSPVLSTPVCSQFQRPYIVLPAFLIECEPACLRRILRHEIEHLRTGHPLQLFLQRMVESIYWFHPMVWWAAYQSSLLREFACDRAAVDSPQDVAGYLRSMLWIVDAQAHDGGDRGLSLAFGRRPGIVARRASRLVQFARGRLAPMRSRLTPMLAGSCLIAVGCLSMGVWLPVNALASSRTNWSPWPTWTSDILHDFGIHARDFEVYDRNTRLQEIVERHTEQTPAIEPTAAAAQPPSEGDSGRGGNR